MAIQFQRVPEDRITIGIGSAPHRAGCSRDSSRRTCCRSIAASSSPWPPAAIALVHHARIGPRHESTVHRVARARRADGSL